MNDLLGGQVDYMIENAPQLLPQVLSGSLRALAVTSSRRLASAPDVPTFAESGVPGLEVGTWFGLLGPRGLPSDAINILLQAIKQDLQNDASKKWLEGLEVQIDFRGSRDFAAFIEQDSARWKDTILRAHIEPE
jgi:tripartite-type tricarboxylate transporter receptor subunit TctC